ncbi:hypothetical protein KM043_000340 [Ampulex compressa]|nr:hypothetical protein KM043_000340 [Ampulex compressa]
MPDECELEGDAGRGGWRSLRRVRNGPLSESGQRRGVGGGGCPGRRVREENIVAVLPGRCCECKFNFSFRERSNFDEKQRGRMSAPVEKRPGGRREG